MTPKPGKSIEAWLEDLVVWGERVDWILARTSATDIADEMMTHLALARAVEVVGEIATELTQLHPEWAEPRRSKGLLGANRMRNRLAHAYDDIDAVLLFGIADDDVKRLTCMVRLWLLELREQ